MTRATLNDGSDWLLLELVRPGTIDTPGVYAIRGRVEDEREAREWVKDNHSGGE